MRDRQEISTILLRARLAIFALALGKGVLQALPVLAGGLCIVGILDHAMELSPLIRKGLWTGVAATFLIILIRAFFPIRMWKISSISRRLSGRSSGVLLREDDVRIALEFLEHEREPDVAAGLRRAHVQDVSAALSGRSPWMAYPSVRWGKSVLIFACVAVICGVAWGGFPDRFPLSKRILFPYAALDLGEWLSVHPGDAVLDYGGDIDIVVTLKTPSLHKPSLQFRRGDRWVPLRPTRESEGRQIHALTRLVEPFVYRVSWKNEWTRTYTVSLEKPLSLDSFKIRIRPPVYTEASESQQSEPEIKALPGSAVTLEARVSSPVEEGKIVFSHGTEQKLAIQKGGERFHVQFTAEREGTYGFTLRDKTGRWKDLPDVYSLHLADDQPPRLILLSPDQDLLIGDKERLPLTYEATDDYGVRKVLMEWERRGQIQPVRVLFEKTPSPRNLLTTYDWNLASHGFQPGEIVRYRLTAQDGNTVTGPGDHKTPWRMLEIQSFEKTHAEIEKELEAWRDQAAEVLAQATLLESKVTKDAASPSQFMMEQSQLAMQNRGLSERLKRIVSQMENNPLTDYASWLEHRSIQENLETMSGTLFPKMEEHFRSDDKAAAGQSLQDYSSELERMTALSEDLSRSQKARDVMESGSELAQLGEDLFKQLQAAQTGDKSLDPAALSKVREMLDEAQKILQKMAQALQQFPQDLPENFVNQPGMKELDFGATQDLLSQIQDALRSGDVSKALELAKQFLQQAQSMQAQLQKAHESFVDSQSAGELSRQISEEQKKLADITRKQMEVLAETQKLELKRLEAERVAQEKLLEDLAKRQATVVEETRNFGSDPKNMPVVRAAAQSQLGMMELVLKELMERRVDKSGAALVDIAGRLEDARDKMAQSTPAVSGLHRLSDWAKEEREIADRLKTPPSIPSPFSTADRTQFSKLEKEQAQLQTEVEALRRRLQMLSRKTASLGVPITGPLGSAEGEMGRAAAALGGSRSREAFQSEEAALHHLIEGQMGLQQAAGAMSELAGQEGEGSGGGRTQRVMTRGGVGMTGSRTGAVRLPFAEDYKPPAAFREELLKALRENYPKVYEDVIHRYYKRLSD